MDLVLASLALVSSSEEHYHAFPSDGLVTIVTLEPEAQASSSMGRWSHPGNRKAETTARQSQVQGGQGFWSLLKPTALSSRTRCTPARVENALGSGLSGSRCGLATGFWVLRDAGGFENGEGLRL